MLAPDWPQKNESNNIHDGYCLAILVQFVHQGCASACMVNFLFDNYKPCPFQNTVEKPETKTWKRMLGYFKDAFSEYQFELTTCILTSINHTFVNMISIPCDRSKTEFSWFKLE